MMDDERALKAASTLPIINIAPWIEGHDQKGRLSTAAAIHAACLEFGFFYLDISSYIATEEPEELAHIAREFFNKFSLSNQDHARGYQRLKENVTMGKADSHEGFDFYRPVEHPDKGKLLWGENQWPSIPGFREKYEVWINKMKALGLAVMHAMATGLGVTDTEWEDLKAKVDDSFWVMRILGYPPLPNDDDGFSCGAHKFLWTDPTRGALQVFLPQQFLAIENPGAILRQEGIEEGIWITVDPVPGCIVCNIGEMWEIWTNGLYKSTLHRVIHRGSNYRIPFFFEPNFDAKVAPLAAALRIQEELNLASESHHLLKQMSKTYEPTVYGNFLLNKVGSNFTTGKGKYD
ncbi:Clavaminate synthase-like protein [Multifurca ochricompacta]|uniref:Clavaminate synthase-like protein n=1 Tax=Multifurca ochricompacta TaxID=376703 RepID=A0AAD4M732_9AGAM|nr:Clavaminate synthase-like protein [Multifurca ochricompacta]